MAQQNGFYLIVACLILFISLQLWTKPIKYFLLFGTLLQNIKPRDHGQFLETLSNNMYIWIKLTILHLTMTDYQGFNNIFVFYLNSTSNFGIPPVLVFQLEVYCKVDRILTGVTAQQKGTTAWWYSNKTSLIIKFFILKIFLSELLLWWPIQIEIDKCLHVIKWSCCKKHNKILSELS